MDILIFSLLTNILYFFCGSLLISSRKSDFHSLFYIYFTGVIIIASISLFLNFFVPLDQFINSAVYIITILTYLIRKKLIFDKKQIYFLLYSSLITFILIIYSNVNRPDAGLYHLPYVSLINEHKIIFGASNIHFRFGHVSILQYLSAINNNYLFSSNGISIPLASLVSFFYLYFFYDIYKVFKKKESADLAKFFSLFILIYMSFKINRYSSFGNDAIGHLCFFYLISCILKEDLKKIHLKKILLISVFAFLNKPTLGIIFVIPAIIFILQNNLNLKKIFDTAISLPVCLFYLWLLKNIITSGCAIFPIKITCIENLMWTNMQQVIDSNIEANAWVKAWSDRVDKSISAEDFVKNFYWIGTWSKTHFIYILNIIIPYTAILIFIILYLKFNFKNKLIYVYNNNINRLILPAVTSALGTLFFFFFFSIYRYGYSYIITSISLSLLLIVRGEIENKKCIPLFKFIFILCLIAMLTKQILKIYKNTSQNIWPNIYTLDVKNNIYEKKKVTLKEKFIYYLADKGDGLCMYSTSPCTTYPIKNNIKYKEIFSYKVLAPINFNN